MLRWHTSEVMMSPRTLLPSFPSDYCLEGGTGSELPCLHSDLSCSNYYLIYASVVDGQEAQEEKGFTDCRAISQSQVTVLDLQPWALVLPDWRACVWLRGLPWYLGALSSFSMGTPSLSGAWAGQWGLNSPLLPYAMRWWPRIAEKRAADQTRWPVGSSG